ncbi:MAG: hypothetical protein LLG45_03850 [Actinomycetia bacterium]|nr:hypothetical protein [Actinomycetes bacterium]
MSEELENLAWTGRIKREPPDQSEFDGLIQQGEDKLRDSQTLTLSLVSRFDLLYGASHSFALAALRWHGYRSDQRKVVFQTVQHTLGLSADVWRVLDKSHTSRNLADYGGQFQVSEQLFKDLLAATKMVRDAVLKLGPISPQV